MAITGEVLFRAEALKVIGSTRKCVALGADTKLGATEGRRYDAAFSSIG